MPERERRAQHQRALNHKPLPTHGAQRRLMKRYSGVQQTAYVPTYYSCTPFATITILFIGTWPHVPGDCKHWSKRACSCCDRVDYSIVC